MFPTLGLEKKPHRWLPGTAAPQDTLSQGPEPQDPLVSSSHNTGVLNSKTLKSLSGAQPLVSLGIPRCSQPDKVACPLSGFLVGISRSVTRILSHRLPRKSPTDVTDGTVGLLLLWG